MRNNLDSLGHDRNELQQRVEALLKELKGRLRKPAGKIENLLYKPCDYKSGTKVPVPDGSFSPFLPDGRWGGKRDSHAWFLFDADVPDPGEGVRTELRVKTDRRGWDASNPQFILYIDGRTVQGMDVNHETAVLKDPGRHSFALYAYTGTDVDGLLSLYISLEEVDEELEGLYYDILIPCETAAQTDCRSPEYAAILKELNGAINLLDTRDIYSHAFYESVRAARARLKKFYSSLPASTPGRVACIGHTHIDVAWKWTVRQTVEKAQRSFATALALLDRYPEYRFTSSQAVLYRFVKEEDPGLWERVKAGVREGRFEPEGAMWVEADCNLPSGESLVRQIVYGKRFFREEFSKECRVLWLPDVFGYSAALPQIMKKSGITKFVTSKISWNDQNTMPFDSFLWRGIDGTEIFTHFITSQKLSEGFERRATYVARGTPSMIAGCYARYQQKYYNGEVTSTIGFGDGGGGTTPDDIENIRRMKKALPGMPTAAFENLGEHLERVEKNARAAGIPLWSGELYLEYHRGTYTSQANNKKNNRRCEYLLQNAETLGAAAALLTGAGSDPRELRREWEMLLLDQFHDIIPGSSIGEVYGDSARDYAAIKDKCEKVIDRSLSAIAARVKKAGVLVWNPTPHPYSGGVELDGKRFYAENIPAKGWRVVTPGERKTKIKKLARGMENEWYRLKFDKNYDLSSVRDKKASREIIKSGARIRFSAYEDLNAHYDAWEISRSYREKRYAVDEVTETEWIEEGDRTGFRVTRLFAGSVIRDTVWLYDNEPRVDFEDEVDWKTRHVLLKREFPVAAVANSATCEIQFGCVERPTHANTSWDAAKFEVCAHKYVDISESDWGVAIMNDSRFGHSLYDNVIGLSLLRGPTDPDKNCDIGVHSFRYALYSHAGNAAAGGVSRAAYAFNDPPRAVSCPGGGDLADVFSLVSSSDGRFFTDTVKAAEDGRGVIVRGYEADRTSGKTTLKFGAKVLRAEINDLEENFVAPIEAKNDSVTLQLKPFEIVTLRVMFE